MKKTLLSMMTCCLLAPMGVQAQLSTNPDKFLGNITTSWQIDYGVEKFYQLWNQITPENETKWDQIEGSRRGSFNWGNPDRIKKYADQHNFPFKFHTLIWGSQYPTWINSLSVSEQYKAIEEWMDAVKQRYPNLAIIDVVNEAVPGHAPAPYKNALGGDGVTGYDWIVKAFEMAYERWPNAILVYNDFNTFQWNTDEFITLVQTIRDAGAPVDAYGCQSHDLTGCSLSTLKSSDQKIQNALKMPMYITEYDIGTNDDNLQYKNYSEQIPYLWEREYCAGITLWGYIYGRTWTGKEEEGTKGNSGLIREKKDAQGKTVYEDRPAMKWLREYMAGEKAQQAKSPFPGMVKEASVYVRPTSVRVTKGQPTNIEVRAKMRTKTIQQVQFYVNNALKGTLTEAPYNFEYTPVNKGKYNLKAVVTTTDGTKYERLSSITAYNERKPHKTITLPGTLQMEDFDEGGEGMTYHDKDTKNEGTTAYRTDSEGVDLVTGNGGYAIGYSSSGEWLEYTVNIAESGIYSYEAFASCGNNNNPAFTVSLMDDGKATPLFQISVPQTDNGTWATYKSLKGTIGVPLEAGTHILRVTVDRSDGNLDKIIFTRLGSVDEVKMGVTDRLTMAQVTGGQQFAIVDEQKQKAIYGSSLQHLGFDAYSDAFADNVSGYYFKIESLSGSSDTSIRNYYLLRLYQPNGQAYSVYGDTGYLNSQPANQTCCFILGLKNQYGQDMKNGAVWDVKYVAGKGFTLKNIATGKYLQDAAPAKYDTPTYFTFATVGLTVPTAIRDTRTDSATDSAVYNLQGIKVGSLSQWNSLPCGLYIVNGKKIYKK